MPQILIEQVYGEFIAIDGVETLKLCHHDPKHFEPFILHIQERPGVVHFFPALFCTDCDGLWIAEKYSEEFYRIVEGK